MTNTQSIEDWEDRIKKDLFIYLYEGQLETSWDRSVENVLASFRNLLQNHNNELIEEIEKLKFKELKGDHEADIYNHALDTVINIIKQK